MKAMTRLSLGVRTRRLRRASNRAPQIRFNCPIDFSRVSPRAHQSIISHQIGNLTRLQQMGQNYWREPFWVRTSGSDLFNLHILHLSFRELQSRTRKSFTRSTTRKLDRFKRSSFWARKGVLEGGVACARASLSAPEWRGHFRPGRRCEHECRFRNRCARLIRIRRGDAVAVWL
jgi:hypothetical protein